jgi:hypothetical protein
MSYDYWNLALAEPARLRDRNFKITDVPQPGFYRTKDNKPVAIWEDEQGELVMDHDGVEVQPEAFVRIWLSCAMRPVTEEWYRAYDGAWPDVDPALAGMGDNALKGMDEVEQIDELERQVKTYREIDSEEEAARAQSLRARFLELHKAVNDKRETLKAPHLKAAREIDETWMAPVKKARGCAEVLKALIESYEGRKRRRIREEREAYEKAQREAEAAKAPPPPKPAPLPEPATQVRGGTGRAASVREKYAVIGIYDLDLALQNYRYSDEVAEAMIKLAQAAVDRGQKEIPGFTIELRAVLR